MSIEAEHRAISPDEDRHIFPALILNGQATGDWQYVKKAANVNSRGPIEDVNFEALVPTAPKAATADVASGSKVGFRVASRISYSGLLLFYMASLDNKTAADFEDEGTVWFKIHEDHPVPRHYVEWYMVARR
ncbi:hypothetical protein TWF506_009333 [Arthrobotrys conoides]|uniref:lytic cellulose monooxygenase (C4-dehydrogenating) n=1 Tax=Arthrobotrys conoides TaxID=74498 RepID=A0AAN8NUZ8_9PEZI